MGCWRHAKVAVKHKCSEVADRLQARTAGLHKARRLAANFPHGVDPGSLARVFDSALECLTRPTMEP